MNQHDTLTLEPCPFCGAQPEQCDVGDHVVTCPSCGVDGPYGAPSGVAGAIQGWNRRAALSATQPAQAAQGEPFGFVHHYVAHDSQGRIIDSTWEADGCEDEMPHPTHPIKWRWERSEPFYTKPAAAQGAPDHDKAAAMVSWVAHSLSYLRERLSSSHDVDSLNRSIGELYQAHALLKQPPAQPAVAQGAGEVVAGIISEWRDVILNARHNMDGVLDNDQINEVLNVWDDMAIEVERAIGEAGPSNAQAQLRAVEKLIDGSQPIDIPGALAVIRHAR